MPKYHRATLRWGWITALLLLWVSPAAGLQTLDPPRDPIPASFFGMHIHGIATARPYNGRITPWPNVPIGTWRLWDAYVTWRDLEPQPGKWQFQKLDKYVAIAKQHNVELLIPLAWPPAWALSAPDQSPTAPPRDINDWNDFVRTVATRYKGQIHSYEIWNEPNHRSFWTGTTQQMVDLTREGYNVLKKVDPSITVVSPAATGPAGVPWLEDFLGKGGGAYVDVIGYHLYVCPQPPESMIPLAQRIKEAMQQHGIGKLPLWDTEVGWAVPKPMPSDEVAAGYVMRAYLIAWASGISRQYWYSWDNHKYGLEVAETDDQVPTPAGRAYVQIESWLAGGRMTSCYLSGQFWITQLTEANGHPAKIVWSPKGTSPFRLPDNWKESRVTDFLGNAQPLRGRVVQVGPAPVLFE